MSVVSSFDETLYSRLSTGSSDSLSICIRVAVAVKSSSGVQTTTLFVLGSPALFSILSDPDALSLSTASSLPGVSSCTRVARGFLGALLGPPYESKESAVRHDMTDVGLGSIESM